MLTKNPAIRQRALGMWLKGMTFAAIGQQMGVTRQRVQQVLCPPPDLRKETYDQADGKCQVCGVHLGHNGQYHSTDDGPIDDFTQPLTLLCLACHRLKHLGGSL